MLRVRVGCFVDARATEIDISNGVSADVLTYHATSGSWTTLSNGLGIARSYLAAASLPSGLVFFAGGLEYDSYHKIQGVCLPTATYVET